MDNLKVALLQMPVGEDKQKNSECAQHYIEAASQAGADLVILPEIWNGPYDTSVFRDYAEERGGKSWQLMSKWAKDNDVVLVGGSITERDQENRIYNTSFVFDQNGEEIAYHRKWHLFDIDIKGGQRFKESDVLSPGSGATVFHVLDWTIGLGICFDIRFPLQAEAMAEAELLIYPAAFNPTTGPLHWELLYRARAMDMQMWTVGVAQARQTSGHYISWANSLVVDPWGRIRHNLGTDAGWQLAILSKEDVRTVRQQIPVGRKPC